MPTIRREFIVFPPNFPCFFCNQNIFLFLNLHSQFISMHSDVLTIYVVASAETTIPCINAFWNHRPQVIFIFLCFTHSRGFPLPALLFAVVVMFAMQGISILRTPLVAGLLFEVAKTLPPGGGVQGRYPGEWVCSKPLFREHSPGGGGFSPLSWVWPKVDFLKCFEIFPFLDPEFLCPRTFKRSLLVVLWVAAPQLAYIFLMFNGSFLMDTFLSYFSTFFCGWILTSWNFRSGVQKRIWLGF